MEKSRQIKTISAIILLLALIGAVMFSLSNSQKKPEPLKVCIEQDAISMKYEPCYHSGLNSTFLKLTRGSDSYNLTGIKVFFDASNAMIKDFPKTNETKQYIFSSALSEKVAIQLSIEGERICSAKKFRIISCESSPDLAVSLELSKSQEIEINTTLKESDIIRADISSNLNSYDPLCESYWACSDWEECINDIQKRECIDRNKCLIPAKIPDSAKKCSEICRENWQCAWSPCISGFTYAECIDTNKCGTEYLKPEKLNCREKGKEQCLPFISCSDWSECKQDYNLISISDGIQSIKGIKSRICNDKNKCIYPSIETKPCSVQTDIYLKECPAGSVEIYSKLDNSLLSEINYSKDKIDITFFLSNSSASGKAC